MDTWDWSKTGNPSSFQPQRISKILRNDTEAGYVSTAAAFTKDYWMFQVGWNAMKPDGYVYLVNFFHSHRGGSSFYCQWPVGLAGVPGNIDGLNSDYVDAAPGVYEADSGGTNPWSSEYVTGFGYGPVHQVRFDMDSLDGQLILGRYNYWSVNVVLRQVG